MKWFRFLDKYLEPSLIVIAISAMTTLLCVQIVLRAFDATIPWLKSWLVTCLYGLCISASATASRMIVIFAYVSLLISCLQK